MTPEGAISARSITQALDAPRLLIVDDEPHFADAIKLVADEVGLRTRICGSSCQFEPALEEWQPAIITLDMVMPGRDGLELLTVLGRRGFKGGLIIISGMDQTHLHMAATIAEVKKLRLAAVMSKPYRRPQLQDVLHTLKQTA